MSKIALMCDSSADITEQEAKELDIHVLRMPIVIKDKEYIEGYIGGGLPYWQYSSQRVSR